MVSRKEKAIQLKNEGNELFEKKCYGLAHEKYSAAIDEDKSNAVLYSNRAACCLATGKYLDASGDAKKATELDPRFSRAWARLATSALELGSYKQSISCWEHAIEFLDMSKPSSAKQKESYESSLKLAEERLKNIKCLAHKLEPEHEAKMKMPWDRAGYLLPMMKENGVLQSSAYVIHSAYKAFESGWNDIEEVSIAHSPDGKLKQTQTVSTDAISRVVDGILRDRRVFCITPDSDDDNSWMEKINAQIRVEMAGLGVSEWVETGSEALLEEAQKRLRSSGWNDLRPAICTTIRAWVLRAFVIGGFMHDWPSALRWYETAIDVLERGRKLWKKVPKEDRGVVFDNAFYLAVRGLHMEAFFQAYVKTPDPKKYTVPKLLKIADNLLQDTKKWIPNPDEYKDDIGAMYGYFVYPRAESLGIKAYCLKEMAKTEVHDIKNCLTFARKSAELYREAAEVYPLDEERRAFYLAMSLDASWSSGYATVGELLPICEEFCGCVPKMRGIWQHSSMQMEGNRLFFDMIISYDKDMRGLIDRGQLQKSECSKPWFIKLFPLPASRVIPGSSKDLPNGMNVPKPRIKN